MRHVTQKLKSRVAHPHTQVVRHVCECVSEAVGGFVDRGNAAMDTGTQVEEARAVAAVQA
jgi:hypothetical protein